MTHTHTHTHRGMHSGVGHGWRGLAGSEVSIQFSDDNSKNFFSNSYYSKELSIVFAILTSKYFQHIICNFLFDISIVSLSRRFNVRVNVEEYERIFTSMFRPGYTMFLSVYCCNVSLFGA